jgi:hypothetical protein
MEKHIRKTGRCVLVVSNRTLSPDANCDFLIGRNWRKSSSRAAVVHGGTRSHSCSARTDDRACRVVRLREGPTELVQQRRVAQSLREKRETAWVGGAVREVAASSASVLSGWLCGRLREK